ncbi:unnamed protein product [Sphenostylis stenocarpa]|uniref:Uncharacterized protein n=1 Tax=Sphenostylis stenocarpa TaxID=92480 RepID=A0AA86RRC0_9FABA|nr:unnamed protein product [Sphenostylis stenocarpa]
MGPDPLWGSIVTKTSKLVLDHHMKLQHVLNGFAVSSDQVFNVQKSVSVKCLLINSVGHAQQTNRGQQRITQIHCAFVVCASNFFMHSIEATTENGNSCRCNFTSFQNMSAPLCLHMLHSAQNDYCRK